VDHADRKFGQDGQAAIGLVLVLSILLVAGCGLAIDTANAWVHRQAAQAAADAACQAADMDMYALAAGAQLANTGFVEGVAGDCATSSSATMCQYASLNGYNGAGLSSNQASNAVAWQWPTAVSGATPAPAAVTAHPFLTVSITENVATYLIRSVGGPNYSQIKVSSTCGLVQSRGNSPIVVLNPILPASLTMALGADLAVIGGAQRGLQVNSSDPLAVIGIAGATVDTSLGGPSYTGSGVGVAGGPAPTGGLLGSGFSGGSGQWSTGVAPMPDPYAAVNAPSSVTNTPASGILGTSVSYHQDGCPDIMGCAEFSPGQYPLGISVPGLPSFKRTAIFLPGVYSLGGPLLGTAAVLRNATPCTPACSSLSSTTAAATSGVMFYFSSGGMMLTGTAPSVGIDTVSSTALTCNGQAPDSHFAVPATLSGTVLWAQCTANGTYYDAGGDTTDTAGSATVPGSRGLLVFSGHGNLLPPSFAATGGMVFSGALYFHNSLYTQIVPFAGVNLLGTGNYVLGPLVADQLTLAAGSKLTVGLNSQSAQYLTKAALVQ
jgi:hypothetical protein